MGSNDTPSEARGPTSTSAAKHLLASMYDELRQLAGDGDRSWQSQAHFFGAAADAMRRILVDKARSKARLKRGAGYLRLDIADVDVAETRADEDVLLINEALEKLEREDPDQARIVVLKFFGGLTNEEVAQTLGIGERTVYRQWVCAKARLYRWVQTEC